MPPGPKRVPAGTKKNNRFVATAPRGSLTVGVKDGKGAAISGAAVEVEQPGGSRLKGQTTAAGTVEFPSVITGQSKITIQKEGFKPGAATVQVKAAATVVANAVLQPATADLVVTVIDSAGTALAGADVGVDTPAPAKLSQKTDAKGKATFKDLPVGAYQVSAKLDNYTGPAAKAVQVAVKGANSILVTLKPNPVVAEITPAPLVVVLRKHGCAPARKKLVLKTTGPAFVGTGSGTFTCSKTNLTFFKAAAGGAKIEFKNGDNVFTADSLTKGVELFAEGTTVSKALEDTKLTLALSVGTNKFGTPANAKATVVELTLDLFQSRTAAAGFPAAMGATDKLDVGRFIHVQDTGFHQGRAILVVREVKPSGFTRNLELKRVAGGSGALQVFPAEAHSAGEAATALPAAFTAAQLSGAPKVAGANGVALFVEGQTVSGGLRDLVLQLGIQGDEPDGDRSAFTVVQLSNLQAVVPSTQSPRSGAVPDHPAFVVGNPPAAGHFDEDFAVNAPLVLLENSVSAALPVRLSVQVKPAGVPLSWSALRDRRPAPDGDGSAVLAASPRVEPTVTRTGVGLTADLQTNAVGSFHVRAFVNNNGTAAFDRDPTKAISFAPDPFILMNLVLVRITLDTDDVQVHQTLVGATDGAGGILTSSGPNPFNINTPNLHAIHQNALCTLIGGGRKGRLGVDSIFAGWINNMTADLTWRGTFRDPANPPDNISADHFATNGPPPNVFLPPPPPAGVGPAIPAIPPLILDTGRGAGGTGGDSACLGRSRIRGARDNTLALGQRIRVEAVDAPGVGTGGAHPAFPAANMIHYDFALRFRSFLCFWANNRTPPSSAPTNDTAERLYTVLLEAPWTMDGSWDVNPGTGAVTVHTAAVVGLPGNVKHSPAVSAAATAVEVRAPRALDMIVTDAQR